MSGPTRVRVRVPATTANLGAGFDTLGLAIGLYDEVVAELAPADRITVSGGAVPTDDGNLVLRAARLACPGRSFRLDLHLAIPVGRGLGSSAAAVVAGLVAGRALSGGDVDAYGLLPLAVACEGHPDNVAPALLGGLCVACSVSPDPGSVARQGHGTAAGQGEAVAVRLDPPPLLAVAAIPARPLSTAQARRVLPREVPLADAVANVQRAALFVAACAAGRWDLLGEASLDRLHQPYRAALVPGLAAALTGARAAGAVAAFLSGAGPTALALVREERQVAPVADAMRVALSASGSPVLTRRLQLAAAGAEVLPA